ncbi:MAG: hypothetical protein Fur0043_12100 [Anaerolineales bacterium]
MTKKVSQKRGKHGVAERPSPARNVFLALTLVPLVIGIILVGAWVLDLEILDDSQSQVTVGIFFFLLAFTASNLVQKRWRLATGWGLLAVADLVTLAWLNLAAQITALLVGLAGIVLLGLEFYAQYQRQKAGEKKKN